MNKPFIAANWKMNKTISEARIFLEEFVPAVSEYGGVEIVIAPPFTALSAVSDEIKGTGIKLASQDVFYEEKGAFTGEISPGMLLDCGCAYAIAGHSERRQYFNDTDAVVNKKIKALKKNGIGVIFCAGESLEERDAGKTFDVIRREIEDGLRDVDFENIVVAYEPIWAIGTGKTATPEQAQECHAYIRDRLRILYGKKADDTRIIYGGSVTPENIAILMACSDVNGALVGGASLKAESFLGIVKYKRA